MIEVELKAHVRDPRAVREKISSFAAFEGREDKLDEYWLAPFWRERPGTPGFRIRSEGGTFVVTRKEKRVENGVEANRELEFEVSDRMSFAAFSEGLGCEPHYSKRKRGEAFSVPSGVAASGKASIELLEVVGLGDFIEIEVLVPEGDAEASARAAREVRSLLERCGVSEADIEPRFYSELLAEAGLAPGSGPGGRRQAREA